MQTTIASKNKRTATSLVCNTMATCIEIVQAVKAGVAEFARSDPPTRLMLESSVGAVLSVNKKGHVQSRILTHAELGGAVCGEFTAAFVQSVAWWTGADAPSGSSPAPWTTEMTYHLCRRLNEFTNTLPVPGSVVAEEGDAKHARAHDLAVGELWKLQNVRGGMMSGLRSNASQGGHSARTSELSYIGGTYGNFSTPQMWKLVIQAMEKVLVLGVAAFSSPDLKSYGIVSTEAIVGLSNVPNVARGGSGGGIGRGSASSPVWEVVPSFSSPPAALPSPPIVESVWERIASSALMRIVERSGGIDTEEGGEAALHVVQSMIGVMSSGGAAGRLPRRRLPRGAHGRSAASKATTCCRCCAPALKSCCSRPGWGRARRCCR